MSHQHCSMATAWIPMPTIPTFCFPTSQKPDKLVDTYKWQVKVIRDLDPTWPLPETAFNRRQPLFRHGVGSVDGSSSPSSKKKKKYCSTCIPLSEGPICIPRSPTAVARFASSITRHRCIQCGQHWGGATSVWPLRSDRLFGGSWYASMACFVNSFAIMLCLDS